MALTACKLCVTYATKAHRLQCRKRQRRKQRQGCRKLCAAATAPSLRQAGCHRTAAKQIQAPLLPLPLPLPLLTAARRTAAATSLQLTVGRLPAHGKVYTATFGCTSGGSYSCLDVHGSVELQLASRQRR